MISTETWFINVLSIQKLWANETCTCALGWTQRCLFECSQAPPVLWVSAVPVCHAHFVGPVFPTTYRLRFYVRSLSYNSFFLVVWLKLPKFAGVRHQWQITENDQALLLLWSLKTTNFLMKNKLKSYIFVAFTDLLVPWCGKFKLEKVIFLDN